ncbi:MAG: GAF domain-containing protein, partial [Myxococcales bacterium]|nr:GAF domain-containing protein [Myxococcales bacterium]
MSEGEASTVELERRNHELSILNAIAEALNRSVDLGQALSAVLAEVAELLGLEAGWVWLVDCAEDGEERVELAAAQNLPPALLEAPERMRGSCYCLDSFRAGDMDGAANINVVVCSRLAGLVQGAEGLRFHASVPLYAGGARVGVLNVASSDYRELSRGELRLLHTIGEMLGIAVERARLYERSVEIGALEERARLARDLHDSLAQGLTGVILQLESADALHDTSAPRDNVGRLVREALEVRRETQEE